MNLNEITGNSRDVVFQKLGRIYSVLRVYANTLNPNDKLIALKNGMSSLMNEDEENLNYWIIRDPEISSLYRKIKNL